MFVHRFRSGLTPKENETVRQLRRRGYAIIILSPADVGGPLNRKPVEDAMLKAGKRATKEVQQ